MKPVFSSQQLRTIDQATVDQEGITSLDLMERAAVACFNAMNYQLSSDERLSGSPVVVLCGRGNNGGDGLVIARLLGERGYAVSVLDFDLGTPSPDNQANRGRLEATSINIISVKSADDLKDLSAGALIIDAVFGTGLTRPVAGDWAEIFGSINERQNEVWAVDVPSGVFIASSSLPGTCVRAQRTFSLGYPKPAEFVPETAEYYGEIERVDFKLATVDALDDRPYARLFTTGAARAFLPRRGKYDHKGTFGHALLIAGAHGTMGAAVLSARAIMRIGAGLLTCHVPRCGYQIMQISLPEAMCLTDEAEDCITEVGDLDKYSAIGIGPGIGQDDDTAEALRDVLYRTDRPLVLDADALNILSRHRDWWQHVPGGSILTPHPKEFDRLFGDHASTLARWETQRRQAKEQGWNIVLKGGHSTVASPNGELTINTTGNPGMATAGAGDVLTGILTGLLAQGIPPDNAARLGVCLHGMAGDNATVLDSMYGMMAGDIVDNIRSAFLFADDPVEELSTWMDKEFNLDKPSDQGS